MTPLLMEHVSTDAVLNTDESAVYTRNGEAFAAHDTVNHSAKAYVRYDKGTDRVATRNVAEGVFGNPKRSIDGTHRHIGRHIPLYFAESTSGTTNAKVTDGAGTAAWAAVSAAPPDLPDDEGLLPCGEVRVVVRAMTPKPE